MTTDELKPGDIVIPLASLLRSSAAVSGALATAIASWKMNTGALPTFGALIAGGMLGAVIGTGLGRLLYPAASGSVTVVKAGQGALLKTLSAALAGAITSGVCLSIAILILVMPDRQFGSIGFNVLVSVAVGLFFGIGSSLL